MIARLALLACLFAALPAAERLPDDCRWMVRLDVQAVLRSGLGATVTDRLAQAPLAARLQLLEAVSGIRLTRDVTAVTVGGIGQDDGSGLIYLRGAFDPARLAVLAQAAEGHATLTVGSRTIHTWKDKGRPAAGCVVAPDLIVFGSTAARIGQALSVIDDPKAPAAVLPVPTGWDGPILALAAADRIAALVADKPASAMLRQVQGMAARVHESGPELVLDLSATTTSETAAQQILDAGRGLAAIIQLQQAGELDPVLMQALRGAVLERNGAAVSLRLALPTAEAQRLIREHQAK